MKSFSFSLLHLLTLAIAIGAVTYVTLYFSEAEAVYSRTVGTLSVTQFVPNEGMGTEFITLAFSGIIGQDSIANFSGWSIESASGASFDLSQVVLGDNERVKICEAGAEDPSCDYAWDTPDVFDDQTGELHVIARDGTTVIYIPYTNPNAGQILSESGNYLDDVYTPGDKITICEVQNNGSVRMHDSNVKKLVNEMADAILAQEDIVPPFVYESQKSLGYHPGVNWPAGANILENGCQ